MPQRGSDAFLFVGIKPGKVKDKDNNKKVIFTTK